MDIYITDTAERAELAVIDSKTDTNYAIDFIGNTGAIGNGEFAWDEEHAAYTCTKKVYDWWQKVCSKQQGVEDRLDELREEYEDAEERIEAVMMDIYSNDPQYRAQCIHEELDHEFRTSGEFVQDLTTERARAWDDFLSYKFSGVGITTDSFGGEYYAPTGTEIPDDFEADWLETLEHYINIGWITQEEA